MPKYQTILSLFAYLSISAADYVKFSSDQQGFFLQEQTSVNGNPPDFAQTSLGLISRPYYTDVDFDREGKLRTQWERFAHFVKHLNQQSAALNASYKVLFLARHGEAYHNVAEKYYGADCWNCYWSRKDGNGTITWKDAKLTPNGYKHAVKANKFWKETAVNDGIPPPEIMYTSPLFRCLQTVNLTFADYPFLGKSKGIVVSEAIREPVNACTCAWRGLKSTMKAYFPALTFSAEMKEEDPFWTPGNVESQSMEEFRVSNFLESISRGPETFISITSHGALIKVFLDVIHHPNPKFNLTTGQVIPVLFRTERITAPQKESAVDPPSAAKSCSLCGPASLTF